MYVLVLSESIMSKHGVWILHYLDADTFKLLKQLVEPSISFKWGQGTINEKPHVCCLSRYQRVGWMWKYFSQSCC